MFISPAYAQTAVGGVDVSSIVQNGAPILLVVLVMYFLLFRPQQQQAKRLKAQQSALRRGDKIVTAGGIVGTISKVINDDEVEVQIAETTKVRVIRSTISTVLAKTEPAGRDAKPAESDTTETDAADKKRRTTPAK